MSAFLPGLSLASKIFCISGKYLSNFSEKKQGRASAHRNCPICFFSFLCGDIHDLSWNDWVRLVPKVRLVGLMEIGWAWQHTAMHRPAHSFSLNKDFHLMPREGMWIKLISQKTCRISFLFLLSLGQLFACNTCHVVWVLVFLSLIPLRISACTVCRKSLAC